MRASNRNLIEINPGGHKLKKSRLKKKYENYMRVYNYELSEWLKTWGKSTDLPETKL